MANKDNIALLSKYQMRVLYYKCKEGATHAEIAALLGRDVNTVQYHMTRIYTVLEIKQPGKSKEEMESELNNEICPIIRKMFNTYDDVKIWTPIIKNTLPGEDENPGEDGDESDLEESQSPYIPPPSVEKILEIIEPPPPARRRINWRLIIGLTAFGLLCVILIRNYPAIRAMIASPTSTPAPSPAPTAQPLVPPEIPIGTITPPPSPTSIAEKDGMMMVFIPAGEIKMGSFRTEDPQAFEEELPQHIVFLDDYQIDQTEVTNAQYALCVGSGTCTRPINNYSLTRDRYYDDSQYANYPVIFVSWSQAATYCAWAGRRLPTEAEWEKAASWDAAQGIKRIYPWGNTFDGALANYCDINCDRPWKDNHFDDGYFDTAPVGHYPNGASAYGVLDMAGNVYEWVIDWYEPYSPNRQTNPTGPVSGQDKVIRGGSWGDDPAHVRTAIRSSINPDTWMDFIGFRCAR